MINTFHIAGELASNPIHNQYESGAERLSIMLKVETDLAATAELESKTVTTFLPVQVWKNGSDFSMDLLAATKGAMVEVTGRVKRRKYQDSYTMELVADAANAEVI